MGYNLDLGKLWQRLGRAVGSAGADPRAKPPQGLLEQFIHVITYQPLLTLGIVFLITMGMLIPAGQMEDNIEADLSMYLPEGAEATEIMEELSEDWSSDVVIIFVETDNREDPYDPETGEGSLDNITDRRILVEMSAIEGDEEYGEEDGALDWSKDGTGEDDGFIYAFSISVLIKELNSTPPRIVEAAELQAEEDTGLSLSFDDDYVAQGGSYTIPSQERIDELLNQTTDNAIGKVVTDTNDDTIWDTAVIILGAHPDADEEALIDRINSAIDDRPDDRRRTKMTQTGIILVMHDITEQATKDLNKNMRYSIIFIVGMVFLLQRNVKILPIVLLPVFVTLIWTFGIITLLDVRLSPIITAAAPLLIALAVAYGLHLANRIAEFEHEEGLRAAIPDAFRTTGVAIVLSVITTIIGFASLLISSIVPIVPLRIMGATLVIGIACAFVLTVLMVPNLVLLLRYQKKQMGGWKKVGEVPVRYRYPIVAIAIVMTLISLGMLSAMTEPPETRKQQETDVESLEKLYSYSDEFNSGQQAYLLIKGDVKDRDVLDGIDALEEEIKEIPDATPMTIVDLFKSVAVNITVTSCIWDEFIPGLDCPSQFEVVLYEFSGTYWEFIHLDDNPEFQRRAIRIFYDSLSPEMKRMLMNEDMDRTLLMADMPFLGRTATKRIVNAMNGVVDERYWIPGGSVTHVTGMAAVTLIIDDATIEIQKDTLMVSIIMVFITISLIYRSPRIGALAMIPIAMVLAWQPVTMAGLSSSGAEAELGMMTSVVSAIVVGVGIDFSIHVTNRIKEEGESAQGIASSAEHTGQSMVEATATTCGGLIAGVIVPWFAGFFMLVILLLIYAMFTALFVLPAAYAIANGVSSDDLGPRRPSVLLTRLRQRLGRQEPLTAESL